MMLLAALITVSALCSCVKTVETGRDGTPQQEVLLQDMGNGICQQLPTGLMWQQKTSKTFATLEEAEEYVNNLKLGGFDDWRLPTRNESLMLSELLLMKKGDCRIKTKRSHWVLDSDKLKIGYWEDYPLCGGPEFRWVDGSQGAVRAIRP